MPKEQSCPDQSPRKSPFYGASPHFSSGSGWHPWHPWHPWLFKIIRSAGSLLVAGCSFAGQGDVFTDRVKPLVARYCSDCHDEETKKGGVNLMGFATARS